MKCYRDVLTLDPTEETAKQRLGTLTAAMEKQVSGGGRGRSVGEEEERGGGVVVNCSLCLSCWDGRPSRHWMLMGWPIQNLLNWIDHVLPAPHYPCGCSGCHGTGRGGSGCNILYPMLVAGVHPYMCVHVHVCVCVWNWWCGCSSSHVNVWYMYMYFAHTWMHTSMHNPPNPSSLPSLSSHPYVLCPLPGGALN